MDLPPGNPQPGNSQPDNLQPNNLQPNSLQPNNSQPDRLKYDIDALVLPRSGDDNIGKEVIIHIMNLNPMFDGNLSEADKVFLLSTEDDSGDRRALPDFFLRKLLRFQHARLIYGQNQLAEIPDFLYHFGKNHLGLSFTYDQMKRLRNKCGSSITRGLRKGEYRLPLCGKGGYTPTTFHNSSIWNHAWYNRYSIWMYHAIIVSHRTSAQANASNIDGHLTHIEHHPHTVLRHPMIPTPLVLPMPSILRLAEYKSLPNKSLIEALKAESNDQQYTCSLLIAQSNAEQRKRSILTAGNNTLQNARPMLPPRYQRQPQQIARPILPPLSLPQPQLNARPMLPPLSMTQPKQNARPMLPPLSLPQPQQNAPPILPSPLLPGPRVIMIMMRTAESNTRQNAGPNPQSAPNPSPQVSTPSRPLKRPFDALELTPGSQETRGGGLYASAPMPTPSGSSLAMMVSNSITLSSSAAAPPTSIRPTAPTGLPMFSHDGLRTWTQEDLDRLPDINADSRRGA